MVNERSRHGALATYELSARLIENQPDGLKVELMVNRLPRRELVGTFAAGFGARMIFQQLSELVPVAGWVLSAAIASSTTAAMGYAAMQWFDRGEKMSGETMRKVATEWTQGVVAGLRGLGDQVPDKRDLRKRLQAILEQVTKLP